MKHLLIIGNETDAAALAKQMSENFVIPGMTDNFKLETVKVIDENDAKEKATASDVMNPKVFYGDFEIVQSDTQARRFIVIDLKR